MRRFAPVLVLILMTPLVAEVLPGSTPITMPGLLLVDLLIYGPGALLIRELVRRRGRGWASILLLGATYGLIEEGLALQSLFHPGYADAALWGVRMFGVNWVYAEVVIIWIHPVWSAVVPILLTELLFPKQSTRPFLRRPGLILISIWYLFGVLLLGLFARSIYPYTTPPILPGIVTIIALLLVVVALFVLPRSVTQTQHSHSELRPWKVVLFACMSAFIGLAVPALLWRIQPAVAQFPFALVPLLVPAILAVILIRVLQHWIRATHWNERHMLALASGLLITHTLVGGLLFSKTVASGISISVMGLIMLVALVLLSIHIHRRVVAQTISETSAKIAPYEPGE